MSFNRSQPRSKQWEGDSLPKPRIGSVAIMGHRFECILPEPPPRPILKTPGRKNQAIRDSAKGEACMVRVIGVCTITQGNETTIWSHIPELSGGRGMQMKAIDEAGCYCCFACHDVVDGRAPLPAGATRESVMLDWFRGHMRSLVILKQKGLL